MGIEAGFTHRARLAHELFTAQPVAGTDRYPCAKPQNQGTQTANGRGPKRIRKSAPESDQREQGETQGTNGTELQQHRAPFPTALNQPRSGEAPPTAINEQLRDTHHNQNTHSTRPPPTQEIQYELHRGEQHGDKGMADFQTHHTANTTNMGPVFAEFHTGTSTRSMVQNQNQHQ